MPNFELSEEEKQLSATARDFTRNEIIPVAGELDEHGTFPEAIFLMNVGTSISVGQARVHGASTQ